jgi:NhaA family Na+:H+ antiporter
MVHRRSKIGPISAFQRFFQTEAAGGALLLGSACAAMVLANSRWSRGYDDLWSTTLAISLPNHTLSLTLHQWINDGLMAVFFLLVGLEIKREFIAGELSSFRQAGLPIAAAIGGMVLPAIMYVLFNHGGPQLRGWAIPMATDIAFALGTLALIAPKIPVGAKVFLTALAIVDDMGAVLVIALFYTAALTWSALGAAAVVLGLLVALNLARVTRVFPYLILGVALWFFVHESGIHSTVAGVLLAFTIPTRTRINAAEFSTEARSLLDDFDRTETGDLLVLTSKGQQDAILGLGQASEAVTAPLLQLEHGLHRFSAFAVMPLFALANAGVHIRAASLDWMVVAGIVFGLALGKAFGITAAAACAVAARMATLPANVDWRTLHGCAWVGGIGFTMALFIASLAFENTALLDSAKVGILVGSMISGVIAPVVLRWRRE